MAADPLTLVAEPIEKMRMLLQSVETEQGPVSLIDSTTSALTYLRRPIAAAEVQLLTTGLTEPGTMIHGDGGQRQEAITNRLRNALAAMLEGPRHQRQLAVTLRELPAGWSWSWRTAAPAFRPVGWDGISPRTACSNPPGPRGWALGSIWWGPRLKTTAAVCASVAPGSCVAPR